MEYDFYSLLIDVFSRFMWVEPLENKLKDTVINAFQRICQRAKKPCINFTMPSQPSPDHCLSPRGIPVCPCGTLNAGFDWLIFDVISDILSVNSL